jgi:alanyl-tRNA synthetase
MAKNYSYIIADHIRTACFVIAEGVLPSGKQRGYILRRLIRRSLSASLKLKIDILNTAYFEEMVDSVIAIYKGVYPEIQENKAMIIQTISGEATKYQKAINVGKKEWQKILAKTPEMNEDETSFITWDLYQKAGVPFEVSEDILEDNNLPFSQFNLEKLISEHQEKSRTTSAGQFKSGLGSDTGKTTRLHTTTHILHKVLRDIYGTSVQQMGSAITDEKARFDFRLDHKIEELEQILIILKVQEIINSNLDMVKLETSEQDARNMGAIGLFGEKYGDKVTVYTLEDKQGNPVSREFCGGPHIKNTSELGKFILLKEKAVSAGVRRLEFDLI